MRSRYRIQDTDGIYFVTSTNPVRRGLVDAPEHWRYSSARNYLQVETPMMDIDEPRF